MPRVDRKVVGHAERWRWGTTRTTSATTTATIRSCCKRPRASAIKRRGRIKPRIVRSSTTGRAPWFAEVATKRRRRVALMVWWP